MCVIALFAWSLAFLLMDTTLSHVSAAKRSADGEIHLAVERSRLLWGFNSWRRAFKVEDFGDFST
jgi:hypothetical protein